MLHIHWIFSLLFAPLLKTAPISGSTLYFIDPTRRLLQTLCLIRGIQARSLVDIEGYVFQGIAPDNKA
jgi:hypothetical protein